MTSGIRYLARDQGEGRSGLPGGIFGLAQGSGQMAHELNHARSWLKGGRAPEDIVRAAENALGEFINGGR